MRPVLKLLAGLLVALPLAHQALAEKPDPEGDKLSPLRFQQQGAFGSYDKAALQRGFLVYSTVCASCHALGGVHYRDLQALGFSTAQIAAVASTVKLGNGPATANDTFKAPFPDDAAAGAAFGGAVPPDLTSIVATRRKGLHYVFNVLTGYGDAPADVTLLPGHYFNLAYPGNQIAMPPSLKDDQVQYADGVKPTVRQEAQDVTAFLNWTADPNLNDRHAFGLRSVLFLIFLAALAFATKRKVWRETP